MNLLNIFKSYRPGLEGIVRWQVEGGVVRSGTQGGGGRMVKVVGGWNGHVVVTDTLVF